MKRRNFLKKSIGGSAVFSLATSVSAQAARTLRLLSADALNAEGLKTRIESTTDGAMTLDLQIASAEDAPGFLDQVVNGDADMCLVPLDQFLDKNLAFGMFATMPFGMSAGELQGWITASDGRDMLDMLGAEYGISIRLIADHGALPIWSKRPITGLSSLRDQNVGSRGLGLRSMQALGVTALSDLNDPSVNWADLDLLDGVSIIEMQEKDLLQRFTNLTVANPNTPNRMSALVVDNATMAALTDTEALILERACSAVLADSAARTLHENATAFAAAGTTLSAFNLPEAVWDGLNVSARSLLNDIFDRGKLQAAIVDAYIYFLTDVSRWSEIGEAAYFVGRKRLITL